MIVMIQDCRTNQIRPARPRGVVPMAKTTTRLELSAPAFNGPFVLPGNLLTLHWSGLMALARRDGRKAKKTRDPIGRPSKDAHNDSLLENSTPVDLQLDPPPAVRAKE